MRIQKFRTLTVLCSLICLSVWQNSVLAQSILNTHEIQYSPDGNFIAAVGNIRYNYFRIWESATGNVVFDLFPYIDSTVGIEDVEWSPDSSKVAIASDDQRVRIWNVSQSPYELGELMGEIDPFPRGGPTVSGITWSPDGQYLAIAGDSISPPQLQFYDGTTYTLIDQTGGGINADLIDWNPVTNMIATVYDNWTSPQAPVLLPGIDATQDAYILCPTECSGDFARAMKWSNDGTLLAVGYAGGNIKLIDPTTNDVVREITTPPGIFSISWSFDDSLIAATNGGEVKIWSTETGDLIAILGRSTVVDFNPLSLEVAYIDRDSVSLVEDAVDNSVVVENLRLTSLCSPDPDSIRVWRVRNTNPDPVDFTWDVVGTDQTGSGTVPGGSADAPGEVTFETVAVDGPNTTRIFVNGEQQDVKASTPDACEEAPRDTVDERIRLTSMCSDDPETTRRWRVRNTNPYPVRFAWSVYGTDQAGEGVVPAGSAVRC